MRGPKDTLKHPEGVEDKRHFINNLLTLDQEHISSENLFKFEDEYAPGLFEILPQDVCTVFVGNRLRFDKDLGNQEGKSWNQEDLVKFASQLT